MMSASNKMRAILSIVFYSAGFNCSEPKFFPCRSRHRYLMTEVFFNVPIGRIQLLTKRSSLRMKGKQQL